MLETCPPRYTLDTWYHFIPFHTCVFCDIKFQIFHECCLHYKTSYIIVIFKPSSLLAHLSAFLIKNNKTVGLMQMFHLEGHYIFENMPQIITDFFFPLKFYGPFILESIMQNRKLFSSNSRGVLFIFSVGSQSCLLWASKNWQFTCCT